MGLFAVGAGAVAVGGLVAFDRLARAVVNPPLRRPTVNVAELGVRHEDLLIPSGDGALRGWLLSPDEGPERPLVILAHGWGANHGTLLTLAEPLAAAGLPVLLFDVRGHGRNAAEPHVTVRHFRDDVMAAVRFAEERFPDRKRVVVGHSLGGAAAVLAAERGAPLDGVVTVAAPADVLEVTADHLNGRGLPGTLLVAAFRPFWRRRVGEPFGHLVPERKIGLLRQPVMVLHPELDRRVGLGHAMRLAENAGVTPRIVAGAGHTDVLARAETVGWVLSFMEEVSASVP